MVGRGVGDWVGGGWKSVLKSYYLMVYHELTLSLSFISRRRYEKRGYICVHGFKYTVP